MIVTAMSASPLFDNHLFSIIDSYIYSVEEEAHNCPFTPWHAVVSKRLGERHGVCREYYVKADGSKTRKRETKWRYGKRLSTVVWHQDGYLWVVQDFVKGTSVVYHENGKVREAEQFTFLEKQVDGQTYRHKRFVGDSKEYDENGNLMSECTYENGKAWCTFKGEVVEGMRVAYRNGSQHPEDSFTHSAHHADEVCYPVEKYEELCDKYNI